MILFKMSHPVILSLLHFITSSVVPFPSIFNFHSFFPQSLKNIRVKRNVRLTEILRDLNTDYD